MKRLEKMGFERNAMIFLVGTLIFCSVIFVIAYSVEKEVSIEPTRTFYNVKIIDKTKSYDQEYSYFYITTPLQTPYNSVLIEITRNPTLPSENFTSIKIGACYNITATVPKSQIKRIEEADCL